MKCDVKETLNAQDQRTVFPIKTRGLPFSLQRIDGNKLHKKYIDEITVITVEPRYLELAYFELPLISKWKSGPYFNMKYDDNR